MTPAPTHAVVSLPALDVRPQPDHRAELASQLLLGEVVRFEPGGERRGWRRVRSLEDGYAGWARTWGLVPAGAARARRWRAAATARVAVPMLTLAARPDAGVAVAPLFLGSCAIPGRRRGALQELELPDGRRGWVERAALRPARGGVPSVVERIATLLGVPYLWGGRTAAGLDCSALAQLVLREQGIALPRDAKDQVRACRPIPREAARIGDLAFFAAPGLPAGHVGVGLGDGLFAHARGMVRINSVDPDSPLCDKDLLPQLMGWYRPRGGRRG